MIEDRWRRLPEILNALEDLELPMLTWGITETSLSADEVRAVLAEAVTADLVAGVVDVPSEDEYLSALTSRALLHHVPGTSPARFRTRLAEGLRLLSNLRQLFPPGRNAPQRWWQGGLPLVADYRLHVGPRRYPQRNIPPHDVVAQLERRDGWSPVHSAITNSMVDGRDLSRFQVEATEAILAAVSDSRSRGVVVGAGTGSGKTLAFYLPALLTLGPALRPGVHQVEVLALYPRKELLRDQAREGVAAVLRTEAALRSAGGRSARIGLLYGDTPHDRSDSRIGSSNSPWAPLGDGVRCPYFPCPNDECGGDLVWLTTDRNRGIERLHCLRCHLVLGEEYLSLTRESIVARPPDILFTTTEMLSRYASNRTNGSLLGWFGRTAPRLVLVDEVHTYAGVHGAQIALLLRRWRNALRMRRMQPPAFVGLSATLRDAVPFFSTFTGLSESAVEYVTPATDDLMPTGREYSVVLRGDPVSGTSLLSATLQSAMLMGRLLDRPGTDGPYGSSGFLFTDDLDVTNRLYDDLRDAEGGQSRRVRPGPSRKPVLAQLRSPQFSHAGVTQAPERYRDGQAWMLTTEIGHPLTGDLYGGALRIARTSSQDIGVDAAADLIVATASLEVGFNDPRVGLVLQHKAPRDPAAFIQRRGRAGRSPEMRPWTVVVLSDYGRDRVVYQGYEQLFYPEVPARRLPVRNRFVLKMQAAHALLDWLSREASRAGGPWVDARDVLRAPSQPGRTAPGTDRMLSVLSDLLASTDRQDDFAAFLERSLYLADADVQSVLWEEPRSILLAVAPTALRRLEARWHSIDGADVETGELLPEFVTRALFDPLDVPDVEMQVPFNEAENNRMPILAALREAVPGRVSRRFGVRRDEHRTWLEPPPGGSVDLAAYVTRGARLGVWTGEGSAFEVVRPFRLALTQPPGDIRDSSQAAPRWCSEFVVPTDAPLFPIPRDTRWSEIVTSVQFALHVYGAPIEVRRMTPGASGELRLANGTTQRTETNYTIDGRPAALGFALEVDGLVIDVAPLDRGDPAVLTHLRTPGWRTLAFQTLVAEDPTLETLTNTFQRSWLSLLYLTAYGLAAVTLPPGTDLTGALAGGAWAADLETILGVLYRAADPDDPHQGIPERLAHALKELTDQQAIRDSVELHARVLSSADPAALTWNLAERTYLDTLAAAVRNAALRAVPDAQDADLVVDVVRMDGQARIFLTETSNGGLGLLEQLRTSYTRDFRRFWDRVTNSIGRSDYEEVDRSVRRLLDEAVAQPDGHVATALSDIRAASGARAADHALAELRAAWTALDGPPRHLAVAAVSSRFLRPGATAETVADALRLLSAWDEIETRSGAEVDARVVAYAARHVDPSIALGADQVFSLLWPRGNDARNRHLQHWQPYARSILLDRLLAQAFVERAVPAIDVTEDNWSTRYRELLASADAVELRAPANARRILGEAVRRVGVLAIDRGALRIYGRIGRITHAGGSLTVRVTVLEADQ
ncbi:protein DpdJ [Sinomonas terrae]|uniref:DEAD/DEAH box helicase n=1 Tax=Sinomonas terrae TaxID=2908838 RepID=A0ABS9U1W1_9MICC|nr:protein DpdJ [Sinomonas terrae]MCH6470688.1 DEAD/DEAH box helicase [Sinomonas terrae]